MPEFRRIKVADLIRPKDPMRLETLMQNIESMQLSLAKLGQLQPIGVKEKTEEGYEIIYGDRRGIAMTLLGWDECDAMVYAPDEPYSEERMYAENLIRNQVSEYEEAIAYHKMWKEQGLGTDTIARTLNVPQSRVESLLGVLSGWQPAVDAWRQGLISIAQAQEINALETEGYKMQFLDSCLRNGYSARQLHAWRMDLKRTGAEQVVKSALENLEIQGAPVYEEAMQICVFGNHDTPLRLSRTYIICGDHWQVLVRALEDHGKVTKIKEAGLVDDWLELVKRAEKITMS